MQPDQNNSLEPHNEPVQEPIQEQQEQEPQSKATEDKNYFEAFYTSTLGIFAALVVIAIIFFAGMGLVYWGHKGYLRWFSTDGMVEIGECGYYYSPQRASFYKVHPNRCVLENCHDLKLNQGDTIGVVRVRKNQYRYVNLNTLSFINDKSYFKADLFRDGRALAIANDSLYIIAPNGQTITSEPCDWVYAGIQELSYMKEIDSYYQDVYTGMRTYEDIHGRLGLMSADYKRLTPALYSEITAESDSIFFAEYLDDSGLGVLLDINGHILK